MNNKQNRQENNPKKKRNILMIIIILLISSLLIYFLVSFFVNNITVVSFSKFEENLNQAAANSSDNIYFSSMYFDKIGNVTVVFNYVNKLGNQVSETYIVSLPSTSYYADDANFRALVNRSVLSSNAISFEMLSRPNPFLQFLQLFGPTLLILLIFYFVFRSQMKGGGGGLFNPAGKSSAQKITSSNKTFKDIAGNKESIEEVSELVDYLKNPKKYTQAGARIPKGILLGGPPGTGKTLLAKATAGEANVPFFFISASSFVEMFVGVGAKRVRDMFKDARQSAPAIIFIDELDAVGRSRASGIGGGNDEREQTLNQLLVEMDGIQENGGILIIAATNRPDVLDPALLRPGRFDRIITINLPDIKEREDILRLHAKGKRISKNVDLAKIARRTPGYSGAQLENVINEASLLSVRESSGIITSKQIDESIDRVMSGPAKKSRTISKKELTAVAYHEAGHAVVGIKSPSSIKVQKITIIPRGDAGGYNLMLPEEEKYNQSKSELYAMIRSFMGGRAAEQIIYGAGEVSTGASDDITKATSIARRMITEWGMSKLGPIKYEHQEGSQHLGGYTSQKPYSENVANKIDEEMKEIIEREEKEAIKIIKANLDLLELIKDLLLEQETIVAEEIEYISKHKKLPPKKEDKHDDEEEAQSKDLDTLISEVTKKSKSNKDEKNTKTIKTTKVDPSKTKEKTFENNFEEDNFDSYNSEENNENKEDINISSKKTISNKAKTKTTKIKTDKTEDNE
ncbi:MAG: ATP-dependent zinc metalloprotease FtsH [Metamycoplasmataceae bacterium]